MTDTFAIEALSTTITVDRDNPDGAVEMNVTNLLDRHVRVGLEVRGDWPPERSWVRLEPSTFYLDSKESRRVEISVALSADSEPGEHRFRVRAYDTDRPADAFAESPPVRVSVRRRERREWPMAGLLATVLSWFGGLLGGASLGGALAWLLVRPEPPGGDSSVEALASAFFGALMAGLLAVLLALLIAWFVAALLVWLVLRKREHTRPVLTAVLAWVLSIPWIFGLGGALNWMDQTALLGWLAVLLLLVVSPPVVARLLVLQVPEPRLADRAA